MFQGSLDPIAEWIVFRNWATKSEMFLNNGVTSFQEMIRNRQFKLLKLVINSKNILVMASTKYADDTDLLEHWKKFLFA